MGSTNTCSGQSECQNKESKEESVSKSVPIEYVRPSCG